MQKLGLKFLCISLILFFSLIFLAAASFASKAWFRQTALSQSSSPSGISFVNTLEGYVACDNLYRTANGGATWSQLPSISGVAHVFGVSYAGGSLFALCELNNQDNAIYVSANSGQSFTLLTSEGFGGMNDVYFANANYGVITGTHASGSVNQTTNAGASWFFGTVEAGDKITDRVRGTATNNIWATYSGGVIKWNGTSWEGISIEAGYTSLPTGIYPLSASTVWAVGSSGTGSTIYKTTNGGTTWAPTTIESTDLYDIWFISSTEGWVAGAGDVNESVVYHTTNGGTTWTKQFGSNGTNQILSLYFTDSNNGWAVSSSGRIFKYTNAPEFTTLTPTSGATGSTIDVTITGANFQATPSLSFESGITVNSVTYTSPTQITANISISTEAAYGARSLLITNPDFGSTVEASAFSIATTESQMSISSVVPSSFQQGQSDQVTINGTNFISAEAGGTLEVNMGQGINILSGSILGSYDRIMPQGIKILSASWISSTQIVATISVEGTATVGGRDVSVTVRNVAGQTTGYAIKRQGFAVTAAGSQMTSNDVLPSLSTSTWNPGTQGDLTLQIKSPVAGSSDVVIYTPSGPIFKKVQNLSIGYNKVIVPSNLSWSNGVYPVIVKINGQIVQSRIVVRY